MRAAPVAARTGDRTVLTMLETLMTLALGAVMIAVSLKLDSQSLHRINSTARQFAKAQKDESWRYSDMDSASCLFNTSSLGQRYAVCQKTQDRKIVFVLAE